jgi:hypothetical protein
MAQKKMPRTPLYRVYVVSHEGNEALWECPKGHQWRAPLLPKRAFKLGKIGEFGLALYAKWWSKSRGGVKGPSCPTCERRPPCPRA